MKQLVKQQSDRFADHAASWRQALSPWVLLVVWILFLYRDSAIAMVTIWYRSETFTHGFIVPPIAVWLAWRQRQALSTVAPQPLFGALVLVLGAALAWFLGELVAINSVTQLSFVALLVLTVPVALGLAVTRVVLFPLGFLFFAVPIGEFMMPQFMEWTANFTVLVLRLSGIPVYREGLQFVIPSGNWSVVEACSGIRYLIASVTVGTLFAYLNYQSTKRRILFVIVSLLVPVVANWLRAYMIVMLGHLSGNKLAAGVDHLIYGWLFFGVVIMLMFIIGARWAEPEPSRSAGPLNTADKAGAKVCVISANPWGTVACAAVLVAMPHLALWNMSRADAVGSITLAAPPSLLADWQLAESKDTGFKPAFQNPSAEINSIFNSQGRSVGLYLGYYRHQNYERKLISSQNALVLSKDLQWAQVASASRELPLGGKPVQVRSAELRSAALAAQSDSARMVVWHLYWINGTLTTSDYLAKIYSALYRLTGRGDDSAVIVVYASKDQPGGADAALEAFLTTNYLAINKLLLAAHSGK